MSDAAAAHGSTRQTCLVFYLVVFSAGFWCLQAQAQTIVNDCGAEKGKSDSGCFVLPRNTTNNPDNTVDRGCKTDCVAKVNYVTKEDGTIRFDIVATATTYTAVGLGLVHDMNNSFAVACIRGERMHRLWLIARGQLRRDNASTPELLNPTMDPVGFKCSFGLQLPFTSNGFEMTTSTSYVVMASGDPSPDDVNDPLPVQQHPARTHRLASYEAIPWKGSTGGGGNTGSLAGDDYIGILLTTAVFILVMRRVIMGRMNVVGA